MAASSGLPICATPPFICSVNLQRWPARAAHQADLWARSRLAWHGSRQRRADRHAGEPWCHPGRAGRRFPPLRHRLRRSSATAHPLHRNILFSGDSLVRRTLRIARRHRDPARPRRCRRTGAPAVMNLDISGEQIPAERVVAFARHAKKDLPPDLTASGEVDGAFTVRESAGQAAAMVGRRPNYRIWRCTPMC